MNRVIFTAIVLLIASCGDRNNPFLSVEEVAVTELNERYGLTLEKVPVVYNEFERLNISTVYQDKSLYTLHLNDGNQVVLARKTHPVFPRGAFKIFCIVRLSSGLMKEFDYVKMEWGQAQENVNLQFQHLADSFGFDSPIVQFINDNHYVSHDEFDAWDPLVNSIPIFEDFARDNDLDFESYDILLFMDLDEEQPSGGIGSWESSFAKVGWFYEDKVLSSEKFKGLAFAAYHHEIGHVWGWEHSWSDPYIQNGFIADPSLFGWTDLDGDGVPEILEPEPYRN